MKLTSPCFDEAEILEVRRCLDSGWVTQGPQVTRFESLVAARHQARHALATTSCTAALHLAVLALELGPDDQVVVPAFTWVTSAYAAEYVGAEVVFADIDPVTFNLDPKALQAALTPRTRAVVVVHLFGRPAPMDEILAVTRPRGIRVIEDAACAVGTTYRGRPVGAIGDLGCFSFHPRKVITTGEGGMVTTDDDELAQKVRIFRNHGASGPAPGEPQGPWTMSRFEHVGFNLRLSDIQAAVGVAQMAKLDRLLAERRARAEDYHLQLAGLPDLELPTDEPEGGHTYQSYVVRLREGGLERRNRVMAGLAAAGIESRPGTHAPVSLGWFRSRRGVEPERFPAALAAQDTTITLPIFPGMTVEDQRKVVSTLAGALAGSGPSRAAGRT